MVMPEMVGMELCRILEQKYPSTKVFAISWYPIQNESEEYQPSDFDGWLQKPVSVDSVAKALSGVFNGKIYN